MGRSRRGDDGARQRVDRIQVDLEAIKKELEKEKREAGRLAQEMMAIAEQVIKARSSASQGVVADLENRVHAIEAALEAGHARQLQLVGRLERAQAELEEVLRPSS